MAGRYIFLSCLLIVLLCQSTKGREKSDDTFRGQLTIGKSIMLADDPLHIITRRGIIQPEPPETLIGQCTCECCSPEPPPYEPPPCLNDIIVAFDGSACFRHLHNRMVQFLTKLVSEIHNQGGNAQFGPDKTRLGVMQFSSDIVTAVELDDFENYRNPTASKQLRNVLKTKIRDLPFLGEGAYLNKLLNATVNAFIEHPRLESVVDNNPAARRIVILLTNGVSNPDVLESDIEASLSLLKENNIFVYPVTITRRCFSSSAEEWGAGLCPDINIMELIAKLGASGDDEFLYMKGASTIKTLAREATCHHKEPKPPTEYCNNCTCDCELPVGPEGPKGDQGDKGDSIKGDPGKDGKKGEKGDKGDTGADGDQGKPGPKGDTGKKGSKGDTGGPGPKGDKGSKGPSGKDGEKGSKGPKGDKGDDGKKGGAGPKGDKGDKGDKGEKGPQGKPGEKGDKGNPGEKGDQGKTGTGKQGPPGPKGMKGDKGDNGMKGMKGGQGDTGSPGLCGKPGPAGIPGETGLAGNDGEDGKPGSKGPEGPRGGEGIQGEKGDKGESGPPGDTGAPGPKGLKGPEGPKGKDGLDGKDGADSNVQGPKGMKGVQGEKGERGSPGADGLNGERGAPGEQGPRGKVGPKGEKGTLDIDALKPIIAELIGKLLPGECGPIVI